MEETQNTERELNTTTNQCPNCGGELQFDPESGELKCERCGTIKDIEDDPNVVRRALTDDVLTSRDNWKEGAVFRCENCGAKSVLDRKALANNCPFCGSSHIVGLDDLAGIKPDSVIPFQITKNTAWEKFRKWIGGKLFAPRSVKQQDTSGQFNPLYSSSWNFGAQTYNTYNGTLGRTLTTTRHINGRTQTSTTVRWFRVSGAIDQTYADFSVQSGDRIPAPMFGKIKPFNLAMLKVYKQEYLSGIIAEHYTRSLDVCFKDFEAFVRRDLQHRIMSKHGADRVSSLAININYNDRRFNYILLPIYIASFSYKDKLYNIYVNGATGKVAGKYPKSPIKIFFAVLLGLALIGGAIATYLLMS
jgi:DNA-directed RNA polymerase subunit RPC12/RpoP